MRIARWFPMFFACALLATCVTASAQIRISVNFAPPALPVYEQPLCPGEGYIWTPGYWAYGPYGYFWVPGTWVQAPEPELLWTPGYWDWEDSAYYWHPGYWSQEVGFYGGVPYGYGYNGYGYEGGYWRDRHFYYNRTVNNINVTDVHYIYSAPVREVNERRVSYHGGEGGITVRPTPQQEAAERETHIPPTENQVRHVSAAQSNRESLASVNEGKPPVAATPKPADLGGRGIVPARAAGAPYHPPRNQQAPNPQVGRPGNEGDRNQPGNQARPAEPGREAPRPPENNDRRNQQAPQNTAPRPENPRPDNQRTENAPHPEAHPDNQRPENAPHPEAHPDNAPHRDMTPTPPREGTPDRPQVRPEDARPHGEPGRPEAQPQAAPHPNAAPPHNERENPPNNEPHKDNPPQDHPQ